MAREGGTVAVVDPASLQLLATVTNPNGGLFGLAITPDEQQVWVTSPGTGDVLIIDRAARKLLRKLTVGGVPRRITFSDDGSLAFIANENGWVDVYY
jgi:YVTN family beta-propeller protein